MSTSAATTAEQNKELVLGALAAARAGDLVAFEALMHPDIVLHEPTFPTAGSTAGLRSSWTSSSRLRGSSTSPGSSSSASPRTRSGRSC